MGSCWKEMVAHTGLEPVISALRGQRVNQLHQCAPIEKPNYRRRKEFWQGMLRANPHPGAFVLQEFNAISAVLQAQQPRHLRTPRDHRN